MNRFVKALAYAACAVSCLAVPGRNYSAQCALALIVAFLALGVAAMYQFVQGVYDVSDKRRMRSAAERAAWNALQASGKES